MPNAIAAASVSLRMIIMGCEPLYPFAAAVTRDPDPHAVILDAVTENPQRFVRTSNPCCFL